MIKSVINLYPTIYIKFLSNNIMAKTWRGCLGIGKSRMQESGSTRSSLLFMSRIFGLKCISFSNPTPSPFSTYCPSHIFLSENANYFHPFWSCKILKTIAHSKSTLFLQKQCRSKQHLYILCLHKTDLLKRGNFSLTPQIWQTFNLGPQINLDLCTSLIDWPIRIRIIKGLTIRTTEHFKIYTLNQI